MVAGDICLAEDRRVPSRPSIRWRAIGVLQIGMTSLNEQRRRRDRSRAVQCGSDHYLVQVVTASTLRGDVDGLVAPEGGCDICIFDLCQPLPGRLDEGLALSVVLPRRLLEKAAGSRNPHGLVLKAGSPMTSLIVAYLEALYVLDAPLPEVQALAAQESVMTLLSAALNVAVPGDDGHAESQGAGLRLRVVDFISRNLCLLELCPEFLCRRFNVSRAHLYRAFAAQGGVAKTLRDMRLDAVYRELTEASASSRSISEMAWSFGFSSSNQLLRSFRARFGITPSEARATTAAVSK